MMVIVLIIGVECRVKLDTHWISFFKRGENGLFCNRVEKRFGQETCVPNSITMLVSRM